LLFVVIKPSNELNHVVGSYRAVDLAQLLPAT